jgi:hypothetical protein
LLLLELGRALLLVVRDHPRGRLGVTQSLELLLAAREGARRGRRSVRGGQLRAALQLLVAVAVGGVEELLGALDGGEASGGGGGGGRRVGVVVVVAFAVAVALLLRRGGRGGLECGCCRCRILVFLDLSGGGVLGGVRARACGVSLEGTGSTSALDDAKNRTSRSHLFRPRRPCRSLLLLLFLLAAQAAQVFRGQLEHEAGWRHLVLVMFLF